MPTFRRGGVETSWAIDHLIKVRCESRTSQPGIISGVNPIVTGYEWEKESSGLRIKQVRVNRSAPRRRPELEPRE